MLPALLTVAARLERAERWLATHAIRLETGPDLCPVGLAPDLAGAWRRHAQAAGLDVADLTLYGRYLFEAHRLVMWIEWRRPPVWFQILDGVTVPREVAEVVNALHRGPIILLAREQRSETARGR